MDISSETGRSHTGARIRNRRLALNVKQGDLAAAVGISASYLNLIEHNKRRIGGKLLLNLARALKLDPSALSEGPEAALFEALQTTAAAFGDGKTPPETDRIEEFVGRFPGWASVVAGQQRQIASLESLNDALRDRLSHDQVLSEAMHEVLSTVSAIRSTAAILVEDEQIDPQWRTRFHRNLNEEAERLSERATALTRYFEADEHRRSKPAATPEETIELMFDLSSHHFPTIEAEGEAAIPAILDGAQGMEDPGTRAMAEATLRRYAADAACLPLDRLVPAAQASDFQPEPLYALADGDVAMVLRRLACLPPGTGAPAFGLATCDAAGALLLRRRHPAFAVPRFAAGCPLWPLYRALGRPLVPERVRMSMPDGSHFLCWSVGSPKTIGASGDPVMQATMLLRVEPRGTAPAIAAGPGCSLCPRADCAARRSPNLAN